MCKTEVESTFSQGAGEEPAAYMRFPSKRKCEETEETLLLWIQKCRLGAFSAHRSCSRVRPVQASEVDQVPHQSRAPQFYQTCLQNQI